RDGTFRVTFSLHPEEEVDNVWLLPRRENSGGRTVHDGWRVGRNPPSVRSSICLIGEPAPQAELTGVYIPFHSAMGARFIPRPALHPGRPGEHPIIVTWYRDDDGMFSRASRMEGWTRDETGSHCAVKGD